ncbi:MAG: 4-hydroxy-tetrahydrodipicolinate synthase [Myxococcales bacterium]|nr:4-hydroxy-tetrahydrodipicolinate synthase [Myxococcales bacterium]
MVASAQGPFEGAITALVTPFRDGRVDDAALTALVEEQLAAGIDGLVAVGTTGESATLSFDEHVHVVGHVVRTVRRRVPVIAGAGSNATVEAIELARAAREVGADGLLLVTPYYNKPNQLGLERHFRAVIEAARLPTVLYNVPGRTGCDLLPATVARLAELPEVVAIKDATGNLVRGTQLLAQTGGRITLLSGDDFTAMPLYAIGARGVISVISNLAPAWMAEMWDAARTGDWVRARELHFLIQPLVELLFAEPSPIPLKYAMALAGKLADELRPPLYPLEGPLREQLRAAMVEAKLL